MTSQRAVSTIAGTANESSIRVSRRADTFHARRGRRRRPMLHEREQILALVGRHAQRARDALEHVGRNLNVAPLLEPGVPGDADAGQGRDVLAAQAPACGGDWCPGRPTCVGVKRARQPFKKSMSWRRCVVGALILFKFICPSRSRRGRALECYSSIRTMTTSVRKQRLTCSWTATAGGLVTAFRRISCPRNH